MNDYDYERRERESDKERLRARILGEIKVLKMKIETAEEDMKNGRISVQMGKKKIGEYIEQIGILEIELKEKGAEKNEGLKKELKEKKKSFEYISKKTEKEEKRGKKY